jgi:hypothetical protein
LGSLVDALDIKFFGGSSEEFFHEDHPDWGPPEMIAERVEEG